MHRVDTASREIDKHGPDKPGYTEGDSKAGKPATIVSAALFDAFQEELAAPIEGVGRALDKADNGQLLAALRDHVQLDAWRLHEPPDANTNLAGAFRPLTGSEEPVIVVWDGSNSRKTSIDGNTWASSLGLGNFSEVYDCLWSSTYSKFYCACNSTYGVTSLDATFGSVSVQALSGGEFYGLADGGASLAICGGGGALYTTTDGSAWTARVSNTVHNLRGAATDGDGVFLCVGDSGILCRSTNLTDWANPPSGTAQELRGVAYGAGRWVIVGASSTARWSDDGGLTWQGATELAAITSWRRVRWSPRHQIFVAVGEESSGLGVIGLSRNGDVWKKCRARAPSRIYETFDTDANTFAIGLSGAILETPRVLELFG